MIHPFKHLVASFLAHKTLANAAATPGLTEQHHAGLAIFNDQTKTAFHQLTNAILYGGVQPPGMEDFHASLNAIESSSDVMAALGNPNHPLANWFTHGGAAWIYAIAQIIAKMFGVNLPPLPPLPPPPPLPTPVPVPVPPTPLPALASIA